MSAAGDAAGGLFGGDSVITQLVLWSLFGQVIGTAAGPMLQALTNDVNTAHQEVPPTPAELADQVIRSIRTLADASEVAKKSGIDPADFAAAVLANGEPPGLESVLEWARRGFVSWADAGPGKPSVPEAIRTSRIRNEWTDVIQASQWLPLTAADAVNAWVRNQIPEDKAREYLMFNGLRDAEATTLYNTTGRPPSPMEAAEMVRRGFIPQHGRGPNALSFEQAIVEGDLKDKWEPVFESLITRLPSLFQARILQTTGALNTDQALQLYHQLGLTNELAAAMASAGSAHKLAKPKELSVSTIEAMYRDRLIDRDAAATDLEALGYTVPEADVMLTVVDQARAYQQLTSAVNNVRTHYLSHKLTRDDAVQILRELGLPDAQVTELFAVWDIELQGQRRTLTESQIVRAVKAGITTSDWAIAELQSIGYSPGDAWVLVSLELGTPQPGRPPDAPPEVPPTPPAPAPAAGA